MKRRDLMKKLIVFVTVLIVSFVFLTFAEDYNFEDLMIFTGVMGFGINSILFLIWSMVSENRNKRLLVKLDDRGAVIREKESLLKDEQVKNGNLRHQVQSEKLYKEKAERSLRKKTEEEEVSIGLGDAVTLIKRYSKAKVYAMRLGDSGIEYQLREKGLWYKSNEIRPLNINKGKKN